MSGFNQTIVGINPTERSLGAVAGYSTSDTTSLSNQFPNSPIIGEEPVVTDNFLKVYFLHYVMRDSVDDGGYWVFPEEFNRNYVMPSESDGNPEYGNFKWKHAGDPMNSFVPNLMSSPELSPWKQPAPGEKMQVWANGVQTSQAPGWGPGHNLTPEKATAQLVNSKMDLGWPQVDEEDDTNSISFELLGDWILGDSTMMPKP